MALALHSVRYGDEDAPGLVILHGLLGSARNWTAAAKDLARSYSVHVLDLRNHGQSPWADDCTFPSMAADVLAYLDAHGLERPALLGHSLGGKVAMRLAADNPQRVGKLIIADIAPKDYPPHFADEFEAMAALDVARLRSRGEADKALENAVPDWAHRQFLLTNLARSEDGGYRWAVNLAALHEALPKLKSNPLASAEPVNRPTLFLRSEQSDFIKDADKPAIEAHFADWQLETVPSAGHNVHVENRPAFVAAVEAFLVSCFRKKA